MLIWTKAGLVQNQRIELSNYKVFSQNFSSNFYLACFYFGLLKKKFLKICFGGDFGCKSITCSHVCVELPSTHKPDSFALLL